MPLIPQGAADPARPARKASSKTLLKQLAEGSEAKRRSAALALGAAPGCAAALIARVETEPSTKVRAAIFDALAEQADPSIVPDVVAMLDSGSAEIRNAAVSYLQTSSDAVAGHMASLLDSPDPDIRIMAVDILRLLPHPDAPMWLRDLLRRETHTNVIGSAIDRLTDIGGPEHLEALRSVRDRFSDEPYICFAADAVIARIEAIAAGGTG